MTTYYILIFLSLLVICSYFFDVFASKTKFPSTIFLIAIGILLRVVVDVFNIKTPDLGPLVQILGTIALILIVLEGGMDLDIEKDKLSTLRNAFLASILILLMTSLLIGHLFSLATAKPFSICLLNAIPFALISSAIAIPAVANMATKTKDFIIYESALCDIFGIMLFNAVFYLHAFDASFFTDLAAQSIIMAGLCLLSCLVILYFMKKTAHKVKFFLIISILVLLYSVGRLMHFSPLLLVFVFGLILTNFDKITVLNFQKIFNYDGFQNDYQQLKMVTMESAFLMRTFFFVIFGFSMEILSLFNFVYLWIAIVILAVIYALRLLFLRVIIGRDCLKEWAISPRGLVNILLFLYIPVENRIAFIKEPVLFLVILISCGLMMFGLMSKMKPDGGGRA